MNKIISYKMISMIRMMNAYLNIVMLLASLSSISVSEMPLLDFFSRESQYLENRLVTILQMKFPPGQQLRTLAANLRFPVVDDGRASLVQGSNEGLEFQVS